MRGYCMRLLAVAIMIVSGVARAMPITYDLSFGSGTPDKLTGSITTDGTIGPIFSGNVLGWSFHSVGSVPFTISGVDFPSPAPPRAGTGCHDGGGSCFTAGLHFLSYNFQARDASFYGESTTTPSSLCDPGSTDQCFVHFLNLGLVQAGSPPFFESGAINYPIPESGVVGTARVVPEPSPLAILGFALAGCLAFKRRRFRGHQSTAV